MITDLPSMYHIVPYVQCTNNLLGLRTYLQNKDDQLNKHGVYKTQHYHHRAVSLLIISLSILVPFFTILNSKV